MKSRYIKTVVFSSLNDLSSIEKTVNLYSECIQVLGGKVVSIIPHNWGVSPVNLIYDIIYENDRAFVENDFAVLKGGCRQ